MIFPFLLLLESVTFGVTIKAVRINGLVIKVLITLKVGKAFYAFAENFVASVGTDVEMLQLLLLVLLQLLVMFLLLQSVLLLLIMLQFLVMLLL